MSVSGSFPAPREDKGLTKLFVACAAFPFFINFSLDDKLLCLQRIRTLFLGFSWENTAGFLSAIELTTEWIYL